MKAALAIAVMLIASTTSSGFEDAASGLVIDLPAGFSITEGILDPAAPRARIFVVSSRDPAISATLIGDLCKIGYEPRPEPSLMTQAELNRLMADPIVLNGLENDPRPAVRVLKAESFSQGELVGTQTVARHKTHPGYLITFANIETPLGRAMLTCSAPDGDFDRLWPTFEMIRQAIVPPA